MYIPIMRERVEVTGRDGVFLVLAVNLGTQTVELVPMTGSAYVLEVSFSAVRRHRAEVPVETLETAGECQECGVGGMGHPTRG